MVLVVIQGAVEVVDIPGDERVRQRLFDKYKNSLRYMCDRHHVLPAPSSLLSPPSLRAVVVMIDSDNFPSEVRNVAELVYDLLLEPAVCKGGAPVLMSCNKQDLPLAKDCATIKSQLEREM